MTSKCGYKKMGSAASCHNCKVWAHPLPSSLPELPQNSHGAAPGKAHAHVSLLAGNERAFLLRTCVMATGCLHQRRSECTQEMLVSSGFGGREENTVYFTPPASVNSECKLTSAGNCSDIDTPCTVYITVGRQQHMQRGGGKIHNG